MAWGTVVVLAAAMSFADLFWVVSLREAAGAVERTTHPFTEWLRESVLLVPCYVLAVLGARRLALSRLAPASRSRGQVVGPAALVALLGTILGVLVLAASSAYDYWLQTAMLTEVGAHGGCVGDCLSARRSATAGLHLTSVGYGTAIIAVTNLVVVAWLVALAGGRLPLTGRRRVPATAPATQLVAAGLVGAGVIHAAVTPAHIREWPAAGVFFVVVAAAAIVTAAALLRQSSPGPLLAAVVVSAVPLAVWLCSRTVGVPVGPGAGEPEPVGLADSATAVLELGVLLLAGHRIRARRRLVHASEVSRDATRMALAAAVAVTVLGLGGSDVEWLDVTADDPHASQ